MSLTFGSLFAGVDRKGFIVVETRTIKFTQFMRPDGHAVDTYWSPQSPIDDSIFDMVYALTERGALFELEMLSTGEVAMYCGLPDDEQPMSQLVCQNGTEVHEAVQHLIREAYAQLERAT